MPVKIVDHSARSEIIGEEPFHVHFWECAPREFLTYLGNAREFLEDMAISRITIDLATGRLTSRVIMARWLFAMLVMKTSLEAFIE